LVSKPIVITAVRLPSTVGLVENVTVREVGVAAVTVPTAPLLKVTVLFPGVGSKPKPVIVTVLAVWERLAMFAVTKGVVVATWRAAPLLRLLVVTTAVRLPAVVGRVVNATVSDVAVAAVTTPTAPSLSTTVLWLATGSKPKPVIVMEVALAAWFAEAAVMT